MKIKTELLIGIIALVTLSLLIFGINFLKGRVLFSQQTSYYAVCKNIGGLSKSNGIYLNGMKIGYISNLESRNSMVNEFTITLSLNKTITLPVDSKLIIYSSGVLGGKSLKIISGQSPNFLQANDTLQTGMETSFMDEVGGAVNPVMNRLGVVVNNLDSSLVALNTILNHKTQSNIQQSFENLNLSLQNIEGITSNLNQLLENDKAKVRNILSNVDDISANLKNNSESLNQIIQNFNDISDTLVQIEFKKTFENANNALSSLNKTFEKINQGNGNIGLLINDDSLYYSIRNSAQQLDTLIYNINQKPRKYLKFSVF